VRAFWRTIVVSASHVCTCRTNFPYNHRICSRPGASSGSDVEYIVARRSVHDVALVGAGCVRADLHGPSRPLAVAAQRLGKKRKISPRAAIKAPLRTSP